MTDVVGIAARQGGLTSWHLHASPDEIEAWLGRFGLLHDGRTRWVIEPTRGYRVLREDYQRVIRERLAGFQRPCPRCGVAMGEPCVTPKGVERKYSTTYADGHHRERVRTA